MRLWFSIIYLIILGSIVGFICKELIYIGIDIFKLIFKKKHKKEEYVSSTTISHSVVTHIPTAWEEHEAKKRGTYVPPRLNMVEDVMTRILEHQQSQSINK